MPTPTNLADLSCPACGGNCSLRLPARPGVAGDCYGSRRLLVRNSHGAIHVCAECGWGVVAPLPDQEQLNRAYRTRSEPAYLADTAPRRVMFARELDALTRLVGRSPESLLDIGCAYGILLEEAGARSIPALGLELSDAAVRHCRNAGLAVRQGGVESLGREDRFDIVCMWDVLEHLVDPAAVLRRIRRHTKAGGILSVVVPDRESMAARVLGERWWSVCEMHLHYPTGRGMGYLLRLAGFSVHTTCTLPKTAHLSQLVRWIPGAAFRRVISRVAPGEAQITLDPRDQLLVRARAV